MAYFSNHLSLQQMMCLSRKLGNQSKPLVTIESEGEDKFSMKTESLVTTSIIK